MSKCVCTIVCVLSDWLTVFRLHHAFGGHENQSREREVGSRDKGARTPGLGRSYIHLTSVRSKLGYLQPHAHAINRMLLVGLHCLIDSPSRKPGVEKLNNLWCGGNDTNTTYQVFVLPVIHSRLLPHHMQEIRDLCGHFSKERLPGGEPTPQTCWTFAL